MRGSDNIGLELVAQDERIAALRPGRHCLTNPGKCLVAIQTAQLDNFSVERETMVGELGFAKTYGPRNFVQEIWPAPQHDVDRIKFWLGEVPQFYGVQIREVNGVGDRLGR